MKQETNRVKRTQEIETVPDYVALSKALQNDMLAAAQHIRNALYDNPQMETLAIALIALDFPHFIPVANTTEALQSELDALWDSWFALSIDSEESEPMMQKLSDLENEIERRENPQTPKATHEDAMARYNELYNNETYTSFRDAAFMYNFKMGDYDTIDICNLLTDAAIEMCHIAIGADVPDYYQNKTGKLGFLLSQSNSSVISHKARLHLFNFASRQLVDARFYDPKQDGE